MVILMITINNIIDLPGLGLGKQTKTFRVCVCVARRSI